MANGVQDLKSLPLSDIIGAPVGAVVQAEAHAARIAIEFIEKVGFQKNPDAPPEGGPLDAGTLRMVEFGYTKADENGDPAEFVARIPLLALFPIPGIRVKLAKIAFAAKITDVFTESTSDEGEGEGGGGLFGEPAVQFRGSVVTTSSSTETTTSSYDLNIALELEQTPVSPGMAKLLNMLDVAISESKKQLPP
ncbi:MAG TPA: DUF2589 domain-containing protein [Polyangiaceae bacterium]|nr:DUF2589 domain-containing protein [Polyangiaceae bacterium]